MLQFQVFLLVLTVSAIYLVWHYGIRAYLFDQFRHRLFSLRDDLFEYAKESELTFESDIYRALREKINLVIRHSSQIRFTELIRQLILFKMFPHFFKNFSSSQDVFEHARKFDSAYSKETEERLKKVEKRLNGEIGLHFLKSYPIITLLLGIILIATIPIIIISAKIKSLLYSTKKDYYKTKTKIIYSLYRVQFINNEAVQGLGKTIYNSYSATENEQQSNQIRIVNSSEHNHNSFSVE